MEIEATIRFDKQHKQFSPIKLLLIHAENVYIHKPVRVPAKSTLTAIRITGKLRETSESQYLNVLIVRAYVIIDSINKVPSWSANGWALFYNLSPGKYVEPLRMHVYEDKSVGNVELVVTKAVFPQMAIGGYIQRFNQSQTTSIRKSINEKLASELSTIKSLVITVPKTAQINCIRLLSDLESVFGYLPTFAYLFAPIPRSDALFWRNAQQCLRGMQNDSLYRGLNEPTISNINMVRLATLLPQWLEYINDVFISGTFESVNIDYFSDALITRADDCDGLARAVYACAYALQSYSITRNPIDEIDKDIINAAKTIRNYVILPTLCGSVTGQAGNAQGNQHQESIDSAHFTCMFIPITYFVECVARYDKSHPIAQIDTSSYDSKTIVLCGESTDRVETYGYPDPAADARPVIFNKYLAETLRTDIFFPRFDEFGFIRLLVHSNTVDFIQGKFGKCYNVGSFSFASRLENGNYSKSCPFSHVLRKDKTVYLIPGPTYTDEEILYMKNANNLSAPVFDLLYPKKTLLPDTNSRLDKLCAIANARKYDDGRKLSVFNVYIKMENFNELFWQQLESVVRDRERIVNIIYKPVRLVKYVEGYQLTITVKM